MEAHPRKGITPAKSPQCEKTWGVQPEIFTLHPLLIHSANVYLVLFQSSQHNGGRREEPAVVPCLDEVTYHQERQAGV